MAQFRKKPVIVEAVEFKGSIPFPEGVRGIWVDPVGNRHYDVEKDPRLVLNIDFGAYIETLEGPMRVSVGDWIITGVKGEKYPCKPDIFAQTYEPVSDATTKESEPQSPAASQTSLLD